MNTVNVYVFVFWVFLEIMTWYMLILKWVCCFTLPGFRATIFWDHMTISQSRPPPLPMCSSLHGAASPAQSRPALWMLHTLPCPPWRKKASPTSQIHPGLKVHQSQETNQQHMNIANSAQETELLQIVGDRDLSSLPCVVLFVLQDGLPFLGV